MKVASFPTQRHFIQFSKQVLLLACLLSLPFACTFDVSGLKADDNPNTCGNDQLDPGEPCDGLLFVTTCEQLGYQQGSLACSLDCELDISGCIGICGECMPQHTRCLDDRVQACVLRNDGCGYWSVAEDCGQSRQWCVEQSGSAACSHVCLDQCETGERACSADGERLEGCQGIMSSETDICLTWRTLATCGADGCAETPEPLCQGSCEDECLPGEQRCSIDNTHMQVCDTGWYGCTTWLPQLPLCVPGREICTMASGLPICTCQICTAGQKRCSPDKLAVLACTADAQTCTSWLLQSDCSSINPFSRCQEGTNPACATLGNTCATALEIHPNPRFEIQTNAFSSLFNNQVSFTGINCGVNLHPAVEVFFKLSIQAGQTLRVAQQNPNGPQFRFRIQDAGACTGSDLCLAHRDNELVFTSFYTQELVVSAEQIPSGATPDNLVHFVIEKLPNACTDIETEENNTPGNANPLSASATENWGFCSVLDPVMPMMPDVDCFSFAIPGPGRRLELKTTTIHDTEKCIPGTSIRLYKHDGTLLATSQAVLSEDPPCTRIAAEEPGMEHLISLPPVGYVACVSEPLGFESLELVTLLQFFSLPATPVNTGFYSCPVPGWSTRSVSSQNPGSSWACFTTGTRYMAVSVPSNETGNFFLITPQIDLTGFSRAILQFDSLFTNGMMSGQSRARIVASTDDFVTHEVELHAFSDPHSPRRTWFFPVHDLTTGETPFRIAFLLEVPSTGNSVTWELDNVTLHAW